MNFMSFPLTSISKKQIVALTGLLLILFIIVHLIGNLLIFGGADLFNGYVEFLDHLRPGTTTAEFILAGIFITHITFTAMLVYVNIKARGGYKRYAVDKSVGDRSWATRLMPLSGAYIFFFLIWHIFDFTLARDDGPRSFIAGKSLGLYGVVINSFKDPLHSILYIIAVCFVGLHLAHGVQSVIQTWGVDRSKFARPLILGSRIFGFIIAFGFSSLPIYVMFFLR